MVQPSSTVGLMILEQDGLHDSDMNTLQQTLCSARGRAGEFEADREKRDR
jgi:hypothetical protein